MPQRIPSKPLVLALGALALVALIVAAPAIAQTAQSEAATPTTDSVTDLFGPEPELRTSPATFLGPCTVSVQCKAACGSSTVISCSGQDSCEVLGYDPFLPQCKQRPYVRCDDQAPIYCPGGFGG